MIELQKECVEQTKEGGQEPAKEASEKKQERCVEELKKFASLTQSITGMEFPPEVLAQMLQAMMGGEGKEENKEGPQQKAPRTKPGESAEEPQAGRGREREGPRRSPKEPQGRSRSRSKAEKEEGDEE